MNKKVLKIIDSIIMVLIIIYPFLPLIKERSGLIGNLLEFILIFMLLIGTIKKDYKNNTVININLIFIILFSVFFFIEGTINELSAFSGLRILLFYLFLIYYLSNCDVKRMDNIAKACLFSGIVMALGALLQLVYPSFISSIHSPDIWSNLRTKTDFTAFSIYNRSISFMNDPNILSVYLTFILIVGNQYFIKGKKKMLFQIILFLSICATQSRTGLILVIMYFMFSFIRFMLTRSKKSIGFYVAVFIVCAISLVLVFLNWEILKSVLRIDTISTANGRTINNSENVKFLFSNNIWNIMFGFGLDNGESYMFENSYYSLIYLFGIMGLILILILISKTLKMICIKRNLIIGCVYLVACLVGDYILIPYITFVLLIGLMQNSIYFKTNLAMRRA